jgi:hypothetical protein
VTKCCSGIEGDPSLATKLQFMSAVGECLLSRSLHNPSEFNDIYIVGPLDISVHAKCYCFVVNRFWRAKVKVKLHRLQRPIGL